MCEFFGPLPFSDFLKDFWKFKREIWLKFNGVWKKDLAKMSDIYKRPVSADSVYQVGFHGSLNIFLYKIVRNTN